MRRNLAAAAGLAAAAAMAAAPALAGPRAVGLRPALKSPEGGLWNESDKAEAVVKTSAELNTDPALNAYVRGVACKVAATYCDELRIYILDRPYLNAAVAPNGYTEVWTGLLLRAEDEAELAFVLGHETSHYAENHSLAAHEALKSRANGGLVLAGVIGAVGVAAAAGAPTYQGMQDTMRASGDLARLAYLGSLSSIFSFNRQQEGEADALGLSRLVAAGYRPGAGADLWRVVMAETAASDSEKVRKSGARISLFDTHPAATTRIAALETQAAKSPQTGEAGRERLRAAIRPHLGAWLRDDLRRRDYGQTLFILDRLAKSGDDLGVINYYRGETYRQRRGDGDLGRAGQAYAAAIAYPDAPAIAWRELGDIRKRDGDVAGARAAYETYLAKAPAAEDAWMVQDSLKTLGGGV